jgi:hypothetical protein
VALGILIIEKDARNPRVTAKEKGGELSLAAGLRLQT